MQCCTSSCCDTVCYCDTVCCFLANFRPACSAIISLVLDIHFVTAADYLKGLLVQETISVKFNRCKQVLSCGNISLPLCAKVKQDSCSVHGLQIKFFNTEELIQLRTTCINMVLGTDMKKHFDIVSRFQVGCDVPSVTQRHREMLS